MTKCKICGARIGDGVAVCPSCGTKVGNSSTEATVTASANVQKSTCPSCGTVVVGEHRFCPQCGSNLKAPVQEQPKTSSVSHEQHCPACGSVLEETALFCPDCGADLGAGASHQRGRNNFSSGTASTSAATTSSTEKQNKNQASSLNMLRNKRIDWRKIIKIGIAVASVMLAIRFCISFTVHAMLSYRQLNQLEGRNDPDSIRCRLSISPLEATAINSHNDGISEKPMLASILVHFSSQQDKNNALCYAAFYGSIEVLQVLLDNGANPNCRMRSKGTYGVYKYTPLQIVLNNNPNDPAPEFNLNNHRDATIKLLIQAGAVE